MSNSHKSTGPGILPRTGLAVSSWFERWFPDAFVLALATVAIAFAACGIASGSVVATARSFGSGFWDLTTFTLQVSMIIVTGYAVATARPVHAAIGRLAGMPRRGPGAVAFVALFSMLSSLVSWSFSLIFSALLARAVADRVRDADYRALAAAAYLGIGSVWALGLSSSAALIMASPASLPASIRAISGVIPLSETLGLWQSGVMAVAVIVASCAIAYYSAPRGAAVRGRQEFADGHADPAQPAPGPNSVLRPGEWLEHQPILTVIVGGLGIAYLASEVATAGFSVLLELNHYVFAFLIAGLLLHWRPRSFTQAVSASIPSVAGVVVQYPLYAGIVRMMTDSGLSRAIAHTFVDVSTRNSFPVLVGIYSAFLGLFVPSAGGKWLIEAPYLLDAAKGLGVHLGWVVQTYNATEALANLIHPFWMLPLLGILNLRARDIIGYSVLQFVVHVPLVLFLVWILNHTLTYVPPLVAAPPL